MEWYYIGIVIIYLVVGFVTCCATYKDYPGDYQLAAGVVFFPLIWLRAGLVGLKWAALHGGAVVGKVLAAGVKLAVTDAWTDRLPSKEIA